MNEAIRDKWAAKLESGQYYQGRGGLRLGMTYCCLGVLCELFREETGDGEREQVYQGEGQAYRFIARGTKDTIMLPVAVRDWAELPDVNPHLDPDDPQGFAAYLNDHVMNFREIAALVRQLPVTES
jgi:hypothetical protein